MASLETEIDGDCGTSDDTYTDFTTFYKQTAGIDKNYDNTTDFDDLNFDGQNYPRTLHDNIENFQYYSPEKFNTHIKNNNKQLSTISFNVRGIACNFDNLITYLNSLNFTFDAIILTECHIQQNEHHNPDIHNTHKIEGYDKFYIRSEIAYGGVIIYVKSKYKAIYCHELTKSCNTHESIFVKINPVNIHNNSFKSRNQLYIGGYYRHCKKSNIISFIERFNDDISNKCLVKNDVIIGGDFNICLMKSTCNTDSLCFLNTILGNLYELLIFKPTRIQYYKNSLQIRSASIIDQLITNLFQYTCTSGNLSYPDSAHHAIFCIFSDYIDYQSNDNIETYRRSIKKRKPCIPCQ